MILAWIIPKDPPNSRPSLSNSRVSWTRHAVEAPNLDVKYAELATVRAACGILPKYGWGDDFFIEDGQRCMKCERALGLEPSPQNMARMRVRASMRSGST